MSSKQIALPSEFLTTKDLQNGQERLLKQMQVSSFPLEYAAVDNNRLLPRKSKLLKLTPFLDDSGLLRIGGRIDRSVLPFNAKYHRSPSQVISFIHKANLHPGVDATFHHVRQQYWILGASNLIRMEVFRCKSCLMNLRMMRPRC